MEQVEFGAAWVRNYDRSLPPGVVDGVHEEVAFLRELVRGDGAALEIGIGTGRVGIPLARAGVRVTGIEISSAMAQVLESKRDGTELSVIVGDFLTLDLQSQFEVIYAAFATILHFATHDRQMACFHKSREVLRAGGLFVVSATVPDFSTFVNGTRTQFVRDDSGSLVLVVLETLSPSTQVVTTELILTDGDSPSPPLRMVQRWCWPEELDLMASQARFMLRERWSGFDRSPYDPLLGQHVSVYEALP